ncbi:MAG TPA: GntR family transcriptional regulator [Burkholderiaceae bacterium]|nr:GntR family transcriptional regulator [Burkholderiaceae bacterium]
MAPAVPLPKYHQVYLVLREQLAEGRFSNGLPPELRLVQQFGVARATVRKALERLATEGLIDRRPGRGTRPRPHGDADAPRASAPLGRLAGLLQNIVHLGLQTQVRVLSCDLVAAPAAVAQRLALPARARVQKAVRVRATRDGPLSHITTWVPSDLARDFGRRELAREPILLLLERAGVRIGRATQSISARPADATVAARLGVARGTALLAVERLVYDTDERPVQWLQGLYRPDRYQYEMQLSRVGGIDAKVWVSTELSAQFH